MKLPLRVDNPGGAKPVEVGHAEIIHHRRNLYQSLRPPVFRDQCDAGANRGKWRANRGPLPSYPHRATPGARRVSEQCIEKLRATGPEQPGNAEDFSSAHMERKVPQNLPTGPAGIPQGERIHFENPIPRDLPPMGKPLPNRTTHHVMNNPVPVSYTHLTLPTSDLV